MNTDDRKNVLPEEPENEKPQRTAAERALLILSGVFFGISFAVLLVTVYINTDKDLVYPPLLSPILYSLFGGGFGLGMLFRTFSRKKENVSAINYYFKIAFSVLVLLSVLLSVLLELLEILK